MFRTRAGRAVELVGWLGTECMRETPRPARTRQLRQGTAVSELAVCLPLLALIVFGSIQACNLIYLKHGVTTAAYEGTLELAKRTATNSSVTARAQQVLDARGVKNARINITPSGAVVSATPQGEALGVEVIAETPPNMSLSGFMPLPPEVSARIVGTR